MLSSPRSRYHAVVVGGGLFGSYVALQLKRSGLSVLLIEEESALLQRASYRNQARVHGGYHYPRSLMTALRSSLNYPQFIEQFGDCVETEFQQIYAIAKNHSKVSANQFINAMKRVNAPLSTAPKAIKSLFSSAMVEEVFSVREPAFNARLLREKLHRLLREAEVEIRLSTEALAVSQKENSPLTVKIRTKGASEEEVVAERLFNCTYSQVNRLHQASGLPLIPLRYELTEMALVQPPPELQNVGVTVMCGPFFSLMPFPDRSLHTLSHVRYTPHLHWSDTPGKEYQRYKAEDFQRSSHFPLMLRDAARFLPTLSRAAYCDSLWEIKTLLPLNEVDDGRPILFSESAGMKGFFTIVGGKIDNVFDISHELEKIFETS